MTNYTPNQWGVTFEVTDEFIAADLQRWNWGDQTDPVSVATTVLSSIREQTMAALDDDGDKIIMGLFEHDMELTVSLSSLVDYWITTRENPQSGNIDDAHAEAAMQMAERFEKFAATLRTRLGDTNV